MVGRPFPKGKSGNPGGRPRVMAELQDLAREHTPAAIKELVRLAVKAHSEAVRVAAIRELLDRGFGKAVSPPQRHELTGKDGEPLPALTAAERLPLVQFIFDQNPPPEGVVIKPADEVDT